MNVKEWHRQINAVLYREWDPIGCDVPKDEYENYVGPVAALLLKDATDDEITAYLFRAETEIMGLNRTLSRERLEGVVSALKLLGRPV